jgi:hypothetical protein
MSVLPWKDVDPEDFEPPAPVQLRRTEEDAAVLPIHARPNVKLDTNSLPKARRLAQTASRHRQDVSQTDLVQLLKQACRWCRKFTKIAKSRKCQSDISADFRILFPSAPIPVSATEFITAWAGLTTDAKIHTLHGLIYYLYHSLWLTIKCVESEADADLYLGTQTLVNISNNLAKYARHSTSANTILADMVVAFRKMYANVLSIIQEHEDIKSYMDATNKNID